MKKEMKKDWIFWMMLIILILGIALLIKMLVIGGV